MKELINTKFKILGYIKFLEFMGMGEEIDFKYEYYEFNRCKLHNGKLYVFYDYRHSFEFTPTLVEHISNEDKIVELIKFKEYLEEKYDFLPKGEELNEYLYRLAVIK